MYKFVDATALESDPKQFVVKKKQIDIRRIKCVVKRLFILKNMYIYA